MPACLSQSFDCTIIIPDFPKKVNRFGRKMWKILKLILRIALYIVIILAVLYVVSTFRRVF